jgi:DNA-binding transcriptional LysR family regulator
MIDLQRLEAFIFAAESLSFSEAGKQMHLSQPTISHHIKALETDLGVELFDRAGHPIRLTDAGRLLLPWARKLIRQSIEIQDMMTSLKDKIIGNLNIACSTTTGKYILPLLAARFCQRHPGIRMSILACTPEYVVPRLLEGEANLGVVSFEIRKEEGLEYKKFFEDSITLVVPADHPWALREAVDPEELLAEPMIIRESTSGTRRVMLAELAKYDITLDDFNILLELGNAEAAVKTVAAGYGISFVSELATDCSLERGKVVALKVSGLDLRRQVYMVRRTLEPPNRSQETFWGFIHDPANADLITMAGHGE